MRFRIGTVLLFLAVLLSVSLNGTAATKPKDTAIKSVLICVPYEKAGKLDSFWLGYQRYLDFYIGGLPQMSGQPLSTHVGRVLGELNIDNNTALDKAAALKIAKILGLDAVLYSTVKTDSEHCNLTLQLIRVAYKKQLNSSKTALKDTDIIGKPILVSGNKADICAQIPITVLNVISTLKIKLTENQTAAINAQTSQTPDILTCIGDNVRTDSDMKNVNAITADDPVRATICAASLMNTGHAAQIANILERPIKECPGYVYYNVIQSIGLMNTKKWDEAEKLIDTSLKEWPSNFRMNIVKMAYYDASRDYENAYKVAKTITSLYPNSSTSWSVRCEMVSNLSNALRQGKFWSMLSSDQAKTIEDLYKDTITSGVKAVQIDPKDIQSLRRLQGTYMGTGDIEKSEKTFRKIIAICPNDSTAYATAIQMYEKVWYDNPAKQKTLVAEAMKATLKDRNWSGRQFLVERLMKSGYYNEMITNVESAIKLYNHPWAQAYFLESIAYAGLELPVKAEEKAKLGIEQAATETDGDITINNYAHQHRFEQNYKLAALLYSDVLAKHPDWMSYLANYRAFCYWELGQTDEAVADWQKMLSSPGKESNAEAKMGLAITEYVKGDKSKAISMYKELVSSNKDLANPAFLQKTSWMTYDKPQTKILTEAVNLIEAASASN